MYRLPTLNRRNIESIFAKYKDEGGDDLNGKISNLFDVFSDHGDRHEVLIKVAALNKIYSTNMRSLEPMVDNIIYALKNNEGKYKNKEDYIDLVDQIAATDHGMHKGKRKIIRNLSFASKYVHFLSMRKTPILDAYIWIIMQGYMRQEHNYKIKRTQPKTYRNFYEKFVTFKALMKIEDIDNYKLDKVLWYIGKQRFDHYVIQGYKRSTSLKKMKDEL